VPCEFARIAASPAALITSSKGEKAMDVIAWCEEQAARLRLALARKEAALDAQEWLLNIRIARVQSR